MQFSFKIDKMKISSNFNLSELTVTNTGLPNVPTVIAESNIKMLVNYLLQPARNFFGLPITVTSGYRSPAVNAAVGGSVTSDHVQGRAVDITSIDNARLFSILQKLNFDQLIWNGTNPSKPDFIHVSYRHGANRKQVLRKVNGKYLPL